MFMKASNDSFLCPAAIRGFRSCLCEKDEFRNLDFDIVANGRYHLRTVMQKESAIKDGVTAANRNAFTKKHGKSTAGTIYCRIGTRIRSHPVPSV